VGLIPSVTQIGCGLGMLLIVPLGDSSERRKLILTLIGLVTVALLCAAAAPSLPTLGAASLTIGISTCVQRVIPMSRRFFKTLHEAELRNYSCSAHHHSSSDSRPKSMAEKLAPRAPMHPPKGASESPRGAAAVSCHLLFPGGRHESS